ncbi:aldehyde dehydrogenase family protein [Saccharothrix algeriensis]|uniref:Aldehyde dehydrogenase family protein n=1 Tax=Saccharothrix algeriensis TaxID=173560 RepID=A0A8T8I2H8_9PSEU|nr:aldehyde dehydrogenase family protein [Saccharothrix algeriensis]
MTRYAAPGRVGSVVSCRERYDHFVGGEHVAPAAGGYATAATPVTGEVFAEVARGTAEDVDRALDAAHGAAGAWGRTPPAGRAAALAEIADRVEDHLEALAVVQAWETGRPVREALAADVPSVVDRFRRLAGALSAGGGTAALVGGDVVAHRFPEPLGVVGQLLPRDSPLLVAARVLAPALAAGNAVVLKPAEHAPVSVHQLVDVIADLLPPGVVNVVTGSGAEAGGPLASSRRVALVAFAGAAGAGRPVLRHAAGNLVPVLLEPGGRGAEVFLADVAARRDPFLDEALAGFTAFTRNRGGVCAVPSRVLVQASAYDRFLADAVDRVGALRPGNPLDTGTAVGAQAGPARLAAVLAHIDHARREGARLVRGGERVDLGGEFSGGSYLTPAILERDTRLPPPSGEPPGPVVSVSRFDDRDDAVKLVNDTPDVRDAGVWSRDLGAAHRVGRGIRAARVRVNHAAPDGCRPDDDEDHRALLDRFRRTRSLRIGYSAGHDLP